MGRLDLVARVYVSEVEQVVPSIENGYTPVDDIIDALLQAVSDTAAPSHTSPIHQPTHNSNSHASDSVPTPILAPPANLDGNIGAETPVLSEWCSLDVDFGVAQVSANSTSQRVVEQEPP